MAEKCQSRAAISFGDSRKAAFVLTGHGPAITERWTTDSHDGKWVLNGEVILVEGGEGMVMQLSWRGHALVTDFGGATLTFDKV